MPPVTLRLQTVAVRGFRAILGVLGMLGMASPFVLLIWGVVDIITPAQAILLALAGFGSGVWAVLTAARVSTSCPSCGRHLRITLQRARLRCPHCDRRVLVEWE